MQTTTHTQYYHKKAYFKSKLLQNEAKLQQNRSKNVKASLNTIIVLKVQDMIDSKKHLIRLMC